jgi:metal-dependent amidase/aminoacylase/carboxypeptidase family protein
VEATLEYKFGYPATVNRDRSSVEAIRKAAETIVGENNVISTEAMMAAEDFSYYLLQRGLLIAPPRNHDG